MNKARERYYEHLDAKKRTNQNDQTADVYIVELEQQIRELVEELERITEQEKIDTNLILNRYKENNI